MMTEPRLRALSTRAKSPRGLFRTRSVFLGLTREGFEVWTVVDLVTGETATGITGSCGHVMIPGAPRACPDCSRVVDVALPSPDVTLPAEVRVCSLCGEREDSPYWVDGQCSEDMSGDDLTPKSSGD